MNNQCPFKDNYICSIWLDYQISQVELEEAAELCHGNWIEIEHLRDRVDILEGILKYFGLAIPPEY